MMSAKVAVVVPAMKSGETGGAERFFVGLTDALRHVGLDAELVQVVSDEKDFPSIEESYLRCYDLDLGQYDGVVSTKAPTYAVRHPNHVCLLVHTMRVFYDMFDQEFSSPTDELLAQRRLIHQLDTAALTPGRIRKLFAIGVEVAERLRQYNALEAEVLRPSTTLTGFRCGSFDHILIPGRLHRWKRVDVAIKAMRYVKADVPLLIPGTGEDADSLRALAGDDPRIRFLGRVSDAELLDLYANALCILFLPVHEDLGLVTLEAFHCGKPVITLSDSGEPARLVEHERSGYVCEPDPRAVAFAMDGLAAGGDLAAGMGAYGRAAVQSITWRHVATVLATALGFQEEVAE